MIFKSFITGSKYIVPVKLVKIAIVLLVDLDLISYKERQFVPEKGYEPVLQESSGNEHESLTTCANVTIFTRGQWGARESKQIDYMGTPVSVVLIHHTAMMECRTQESCVQEMKVIQNFHMDNRGWDDIGYNFVVGQNGKAYEARSWDRIGAHTLGWNKVAISISVMGDYSFHVPEEDTMNAVKAVIACGVQKQKISPDYKLYAHRDVRDTESPGDNIYALIRTWDHYDANKPVKPTPIPYQGTLG